MSNSTRRAELPAALKNSCLCNLEKGPHRLTRPLWFMSTSVSKAIRSPKYTMGIPFTQHGAQLHSVSQYVRQLGLCYCCLRIRPSSSLARRFQRLGNRSPRQQIAGLKQLCFDKPYFKHQKNKTPLTQMSRDGNLKRCHKANG